MALEVRVEEVAEAALPGVDYRWDADTDILVATLRATAVSEGLNGSIDIEGGDGAWLTLELSGGRLSAVEVAVWPDVKTVPTLPLPEGIAAGRMHVPQRRSDAGLAAVEVEARIRAVADAPEQTIHFRVGPTRATRTVRVARDLLLELDGKSHIAGLWFLNVPPFPTPP
ncbi:MAG: hypothetical protein KF709_09625 [Gemmatimonadaceae bacterium]|nr:hypothetical protein [Gemmatimonadaceae bacterium]